MAEKARLKRKQIKQPDEFITLTSRAMAWVQQHQQLAIWSGVGVLTLLVGVGIATAYRGARERDANADLGSAMSKLGTKDYAGAASALLDVSSRWEGTTVAQVAGLLGANAAIDAEQADKAITELSGLQTQSAALPVYLQQQILVAWGAALETKQQWLDAAGKYKEAAALTGPYTGLAIIGEARTRELGGEADRARELYRQAYEQFPNLPNREQLAAKL